MSFVNPLFLAGALAAAIPIVLHLIRRERGRQIEFPSLMFLRRINKKTIRYQKLRHLLLLLLRILAFMMIVLAFMRPYRERGAHEAAIAGEISQAHVLLIDQSLSMGYQNRWERARQAAADIVRKARTGDRFAVFGFSNQAVLRMPLTSDPSDALSAIRKLELTDHATRFVQALRSAEKYALDAGTARRAVYLISDFQKNGWAPEDRDFRLSPGIDLHPVDVGSDDYSNLAVRDVRVTRSGEGGENSIGINAAVFNFGNAGRKNAAISLWADGRFVSQRNIDIAKDGSRPVEFELPKLTAGLHQLRLDVEDANLVRDNRFYLTVQSRGKTPVTVIENSSGSRRAPSFFLSRALNIDAFSPYRLTIVSPQAGAFEGGLLICNNVFITGMQNRLKDFVTSGGGMAVVVADGSQALEFNRSFGSWLPVKVLGPSGSESFSQKRPAENYALLTDVRMDHPVFQPFSRPHSGSFSSARFFQYARLSAGEGTEVAARFDNGDPAVVSMAVGRGRVLIFASSADDSANDLPLKAVYAPMWQQILHYLENFQDRRNWLDVGETISPRKLLLDSAERQVKAASEDGPVAVFDPGRERLSAASDAVALEKAGFYEIRSQSRTAALAVNASARESDLRHGNAEEMTAAWISTGSRVRTNDESPSAEEQDRQQRIWFFLIIAALLLLISELFLSNLHIKSADSKGAPGQMSGASLHSSTVNRRL